MPPHSHLDSTKLTFTGRWLSGKRTAGALAVAGAAMWAAMWSVAAIAQQKPPTGTGASSTGGGQSPVAGGKVSGNLNPGSAQLPPPGGLPQVSPPDLDVAQVRILLPQLNRIFLVLPVPSPQSTFALLTGTGKPAFTPLGATANGTPRFAVDTCATPLAAEVTVNVRNIGGSTYDVTTPPPEGGYAKVTAGYDLKNVPLPTLPPQQTKLVKTNLGIPTGVQTVQVQLFPGQSTGEQNTANNTWTGQLALDCGPLRAAP